MCSKCNGILEPEPPREPQDIYAEYLKRIEEFKKRMKGDDEND